jgi:hypothetical protein
MNTNQSLQALAAGILLIGLVSLAASRVATLPFVLAGETAFWTGVIAVSVGFVMLADLRRRSREKPRQEPSQS